MNRLNIKEVANKSSISSFGDYCFAASPAKAVILSCPLCGELMHLSHEIKQRNPLTISSSVVGPWPGAIRHCGHHFFIENGTVKILN